jgi:hypothetical protein
LLVSTIEDVPCSLIARGAARFLSHVHIAQLQRCRAPRKMVVREDTVQSTEYVARTANHLLVYVYENQNLNSAAPTISDTIIDLPEYTVSTTSPLPHESCMLRMMFRLISVPVYGSNTGVNNG